jgi:hypothetical protein
MKTQPQFLRIRWEDTTEQGAVVTLETMACLRHRKEIALATPVPEGFGGWGKPAISVRAAIPDHSERSSPIRTAVNSVPMILDEAVTVCREVVGIPAPLEDP